jgi:hypothetical protein
LILKTIFIIAQNINAGAFSFEAVGERTTGLSRQKLQDVRMARRERIKRRRQEAADLGWR